MIWNTLYYLLFYPSFRFAQVWRTWFVRKQVLTTCMFAWRATIATYFSLSEIKHMNTATGTSFYTHGETQVERLEAYIMGDGYFPAPQMTDVENVENEEVSDASIKYLHDGQLYICKNGKKYTILGLEL